MSKKHLLALIGALLLWGTSFPAMKWALGTNEPITIIFYRFLFTFALLLAPFFWKYRRNVGRMVGNKVLFWMGALNFLGLALQIVGINYTTSTKSVIITQMLIVMVPFPAYFILKERLDKRKVLGIIFSTAGAVVLSTNLKFEGLLDHGTVLGDLIILASVVLFSFYIVLTRKWTLRVDGFTLLYYNVLAAFLMAFVGVLIFNKFRVDTVGLVVALYLAIFSTIIPFLMYFYSLREVDAITSTIIGPTEILSGAVLAFLFLGESLSLVEIGGGVLIFLALYIVAVKRKRGRKDLRQT